MSILYRKSRLFRKFRDSALGERIAGTSVYQRLKESRARKAVDRFWEGLPGGMRRVDERLRRACERLRDSGPGLLVSAVLRHRGIRAVLPHVTRRDVFLALRAYVAARRSIKGRVCGEPADSLAQYLAVAEFIRAQGGRSVDSLELGTLFGGSCLMKLFALRDAGRGGVVTCIDPMTGYYGERLDPVSGVPVTPETFHGNIERFGFSRDSVVLVRMKSTEAGCRESLREAGYATLLIDADHGYAGVRHDWENFSAYVAPGGYVLFDDYDDPAWPEVTRFVDQNIRTLRGGWKGRGSIGTTYIVQRGPMTRRP